jgi:hypothetical protein
MTQSNFSTSELWDLTAPTVSVQQNKVLGINAVLLRAVEINGAF